MEKAKKRRKKIEQLEKSVPSLLAAFQIGIHVSSFGFDWSGPLDSLQKVKEEISELERALEAREEKEISQEIGDIFFALANVSRLLGVNPEKALKKTNEKFMKRFAFVEKKLKEQGKELGQASLEEMDKIWEESKKLKIKK